MGIARALRCSLAVVFAALVGSVVAGTGPVTTINIVNAHISPDGFTRDAVLAGGTFPGPLITGKKVWKHPSRKCREYRTEHSLHTRMLLSRSGGQLPNHDCEQVDELHDADGYDCGMTTVV